MAVYEVTAPDGAVYEVEAPTEQEAVEAVRAQAGQPAMPDPSEEFFLNPDTGQMTSRELLRNAYQGDAGTGEAFAGGTMQGLAFNYGDEAMGGMGAIEGAIRPDATASDMARFRQEQARAKLEAMEEGNRGAFIGGQVAGQLAWAPTIGKFAQGATPMGTLGRATALGAAEGAAFGSGQGEDLESRLAMGARDAAIGGGIGAASVPLAWMLQRGGRAAADAWRRGRSAVSSAPDDLRAAQAITKYLDDAGMTADEVADAVEDAGRLGNEGFVAADAMGDTGERALNKIVRPGGKTASEAAEFLRDRQGGAGDRVVAALRRAFGLQADDLAQADEAMVAARRAEAEPLWDAARANATPADVGPVLQQVDEFTGAQPLTIAGDSFMDTALGRKVAAIGKQLRGAKGSQTFDFDRVKQVRTELRRWMENQRGALAPEYNRLYSALTDVLEESSGEFRAASDAYKRASDAIEALQTGASWARPGTPSSEIVRALQDMSERSKGAAREGYGLAQTEAVLRNRTDAGDLTRPLIGSPRDRVVTALLSNEGDDTVRMLQNERKMLDTYRRSMTGSRTADNLADEAAGAQLMGSAIRSGPREAAWQAIGSIWNTTIAPVLSGQNEATRRIVFEALTSDNPREALRAAVEAGRVPIGIARELEAAIRAASRPTDAPQNAGAMLGVQ